MVADPAILIAKYGSPDREGVIRSETSNHLVRDRLLAAKIAMIMSATEPRPIHVHGKEEESLEVLADGLGLSVATGETDD